MKRKKKREGKEGEVGEREGGLGYYTKKMIKRKKCFDWRVKCGNW